MVVRYETGAETIEQAGALSATMGQNEPDCLCYRMYT